MNYKILTKVLEELTKEKPDTSYMRGMIETLLSFEEKDVMPAQPKNEVKIVVPQTPKAETSDEGKMLDAAAAARLEKIKQFATYE